MSAGTLTLATNSDAVTGTGTAFTTELVAGDFTVVVVGGITYTLPVKSVDSATKLTLSSKYSGPSQNGLAWNAVPRATQNLITAAVIAQATEALRGLNYDKQNWQQVFSGTGTITVKLPDGTTYNGPAWNGIATTINGKAAKGDNSDITSLSGLTSALSVAQGGTGQKSPAGARTALGVPAGVDSQICTAWVLFNGITGGVRSAFNVSSITKNGTGDYTINFSTPMNTNLYCCNVGVMAPRPDAVTRSGVLYASGDSGNTGLTVDNCRILVGNTVTTGLVDQSAISAVFFGGR